MVNILFYILITSISVITIFTLVSIMGVIQKKYPKFSKVSRNIAIVSFLLIVCISLIYYLFFGTAKYQDDEHYSGSHSTQY